MKPPWRSKFHRRIVSGQRREFARIRRFIQRKYDECESRIIAVFVQKRRQTASVFNCDWDISTFVQTETLDHAKIMISIRARMELHYQSVFDAHPSVLHDHMAGEPNGVFSRRFAAESALKDFFSFLF